MSIFSKVTLKSLVKNRVRTVVTVIGILLSAAMITAVTVSVSSFMRYMQAVTVADTGLWHGVLDNLPASMRDELEADSRFDSASYAQVMGWYDASGGKAGGSVYLQVLGCDNTFFDRMPMELSRGRMPENPGEILLSSISPLDDVELGDTIALELGDRYVDGQLLNGLTSWQSGEELKVRDTREYTVVGFMRRPSFQDGSMPGMMAFTCWDEDAGAPYLTAYFTLKKPGDIYAFQADWSEKGVGSVDNTDYLMTLGLSRFDTFFKVLYSFAAILIGLIMFGSVSLIYNAFSISVAERTKQFGLLRSVGATKKQIRSMVFTEALTVSGAGIPLGIMSGILGMAVTFHFIGGYLSSLFNGRKSGSIPLRVYVSPWSVAAAAAIGLVTVLISAWVPSRRATKISAMEAIRQTGDVKIKRREVRTSPLTYRLFGLEGAIAGKHFKRDRKRYRATVVSLFMSVVLFISASSFCRYLLDTTRAALESYDYDVELWSHYDTDIEDYAKYPGFDSLPQVLEAFSASPNIKEVSAVTRVDNIPLTFRREDAPEEAWEEMERFFGSHNGIIEWQMDLYGVEDGQYRAYLRKNGLSEEEYMGGDPKLVVRPSITAFDSDTQRLETLRIDPALLKTVSFSYDGSGLEHMDPGNYTVQEAGGSDGSHGSGSYSYEVGYMTDELVLGLNTQGEKYSLVALMPLSEARKIDTGKTAEDTEMFFTVKKPGTGGQDVLAASEAAGLPFDEGDIYDIYAANAPQRDLVTVIRVISYGFIALISAIAAVNVFNTVSTNILLRRREFAMLRSVGMTNRGFNRMMNFECLLYGTKALLLGVPTAFAVTYLIFRAVQSAMDTAFYLPWTAVAIAVGSVFLVVFLSMMYSMAGIKRDNPIEALKNEVI